MSLNLQPIVGVEKMLLIDNKFDYENAHKNSIIL